MAKKPTRVRILMMPYQEDEDSDSVGYSGPATVLTGLPRTIRRHELRPIVPLADSTIYEMEKRGEFPRRFNLTPAAWCGIWKRWKLGSNSADRPIWPGARRSLPALMSVSGRPGR